MKKWIIVVTAIAIACAAAFTGCATRGESGLQGPKGEQGATGPQGPQGERGEAGVCNALRAEKTEYGVHESAVFYFGEEKYFQLDISSLYSALGTSGTVYSNLGMCICVTTFDYAVSKTLLNQLVYIELGGKVVRFDGISMDHSVIQPNTRASGIHLKPTDGYISANGETECNILFCHSAVAVPFARMNAVPLNTFTVEEGKYATPAGDVTDVYYLGKKAFGISAALTKENGKNYVTIALQTYDFEMDLRLHSMWFLLESGATKKGFAINEEKAGERSIGKNQTRSFKVEWYTDTKLEVIRLAVLGCETNLLPPLLLEKTFV